MILTVLKWLSCGVAVAWLAVGYLTLLLMYYGAMESLASLMGELAIVVRVVGLSTLLWILGFPLLSLALHSSQDLKAEDLDASQTKS
jgi:hypothetical protein